jgi:hypothetical protein
MLTSVDGNRPETGSTDVRRAFLAAVDAARTLLLMSAVPRRWQAASALPEFTLRGLAGHLVRAATTVLDDMRAPEPAGEPLPAAAYLARIPPAPALDSDLARAVRQRGEHMAAAGLPALLAALDGARAELERVLSLQPPTRRVAVLGGQVMLLDDYLLTRILELLVHTDDLAASAGLPERPLPSAALELALRHLLDVARLRHGDLAVLRAFTRRERDTHDALRIF